VNHSEHLFLASEVAEIQAILAEIPEDRVIDRMSFQKRLNNAKEALAKIRPGDIPKKARLTFRGNPVVGSYGISAEFASKASSYFADAFAAIVAGIGDNLRYMGPIPDKQKNQLFITGTAIGSFGFEYELPSPLTGGGPAQHELEFGGPPNAEVAMEKLGELFRIAAEGSDDDLSELVDEIHPRAVKKVAEFLKYVTEEGAYCGLEFQESLFRFAGSDQVRSSLDRLNDDNIRETTQTLSGYFEGVLPTGRRFEFKAVDQEAIVRGKLGPDVKDPHVINREYLSRIGKITLSVVQVGQGRPRYTLAKLDDIQLGAGG